MPVAEVAIRRADEDDAESLYALGCDVINATYGPIISPEYARYVIDTWWLPEHIAASMAWTTHLIAESGGRAVGTATFGERDGDAVLWKLYLRAECQGTGLGARLLAEVIGLLPPGTPRLLLSHLDGNVKAAAFYRGRGFEYVRTEPDPDGWPDQIWMAKPLP